MKKLLLTGFIISFFAEINFAQSITFQKSFAGGAYTIGRCVRQTNDGGYIFTGYAEVLGAGINDVYLVKTDAGGDTLWTKTFGGTGYDDGFSVEQTSDEGYIITGYTSSFGAGSEDVYLIKTNSMGELLWSKTYGGPNVDRGASVHQTDDGGYIISGETISYGAANHDVYVIKTNDVGDTLWTKVMGTANDNYGYDVIETLDGNYMVSGGHGPGGAYLVKLNLEGDSLWTKGFIAEGPAHLNNAQSVKQNSDSSFVFTGIAYGATGIQSYLQKTDSLGNALWAKTFSGVNHVYTTDIDICFDGGYILSGWSQAFPNGTYKSILIKTDAVGDTLWTKRFIGGGSYSSVQQTADGGFVLLSADNFNIYLTKTDSEGNAGCDDSNAWPVVTDVIPAVGVPSVALNSGGITGNPITLIESGGTITSLCFECNLEISFNDLPDTICIADGLQNLVGIPAGGIFEGNGVSGSSFNPETAGVGTHLLTYTFSLSPDCFQVDTVYAYVDLCFECTLDVIFNSLPDTVCVAGVVWPLVGLPPDGVFSGAGVSNTTFSPATAGVGFHQLIYTVVLAEDCTDSDTISVFVDECVGVNEWNEQTSFFIFPNPTNDAVQIVCVDCVSDEIELQIFDVMGKEIFSETNHSKNFQLHTINWPNGIYFCQMNSSYGVFTQKFVVEH